MTMKEIQFQKRQKFTNSFRCLNKKLVTQLIEAKQDFMINFN